MLFKLMDSRLVTFLFVLLSDCLSLYQTASHYPSLPSLSLPHEMPAGWPIQGVSYWNSAVASGLKQCVQELAAKNVGMGRGGTSEMGHSFYRCMKYIQIN